MELFNFKGELIEGDFRIPFYSINDDLDDLLKDKIEPVS
jgi:hypothetical protein